MSDTEMEPTPGAGAVEEEASGGTAVAVAERPGALATVDVVAQRAELRKDRLLLPFLLPVGAILAVALFAINLSRIFLAASEGGTTPAVVAATLVTLSILIGATVVAAIPTLRTSSLVLTVCGVAALVLLSGSLVLGAAENKVAAVTEPAGPAINTLDVDASNFQFQKTVFEAPAGINEIKYVSIEGGHTLAFKDAPFSYVNLKAPGTDNITKVTFVKGQTYTIYCTLPGHEAQGMKATIKVVDTPAGAAPEAGTSSPSSTLPGPSSTTTPNGQSEVDPASQSGNETGN